ncbi:hypothetical protein EV384_4733 [Micromonospora kangleipakensis]|uniref:histidine kinase n=1 Tax=Micromonospora kangleipakensis TaxID=1077942 RepID=A0A4Q8BDX8_9ACTN|nr:hypothetical protein [Micromonospora kangleipakensis]RZU76117.1 hypothetical protein EV384_4733 [Micromonospora kangleipakensis]
MSVVSALDLLVGAVVLGSGAVAWRTRPGSRVGLLMVLAGLAWFAGYLTPSLVFLHRGPLTHLHLAYPTGRLRGPLSWVAVAAAYLAAITEAFARSPWLQVILAALVVVTAFQVFGRTSGPARVAARPALLAACAFALVLLLGGVNQLFAWRLDLPVLLAYDTVVALVVVVLLVDLLRGGWTDAALAELVTNVGRGLPTGLRAQLRRAMGDPAVEIGLWRADRGSYVAEDGTVLDLTGDNRAATRVDEGDEPLAVVAHDPVLLGDPELIAGVASVVRLAVSNNRLNAEIDAAVTELRASRRRLVEIGDAQCRRLEAVLVAGPYEQLDLAAGILRECGPLNGERDRLLIELHAARAEMDAFARGVRPPSLAAGGLSAALRELAQRSAVPVTVTADVRRLPPAVEAAVYFCCSEGLANIAKHAGATAASIEITADGRKVVAHIGDDGGGGADRRSAGLRGLADRVEALDGILTVVSPPGGGTQLVVSLPLAGKEE